MFIGWSGTLPDEYLIYVRGITDVQPYPVCAITVELGILALSFALPAWAARARRWKRVGKMSVAAVLTGAVGIFAAMGSMHMPQHFIYFALSMLAISAVSLLAVVLLSTVCLSDRKKSALIQR
jgi:uncharacterized membrane protein YhaH (DUF805 family)